MAKSSESPFTSASEDGICGASCGRSTNVEAERAIANRRRTSQVCNGAPIVGGIRAERAVVYRERAIVVDCAANTGIAQAGKTQK